MKLWFATSDISASHKELGDKGINVSKVADDLHGPGSGVTERKMVNTELESHIDHLVIGA